MGYCPVQVWTGQFGRFEYLTEHHSTFVLSENLKLLNMLSHVYGSLIGIKLFTIQMFSDSTFLLISSLGHSLNNCSVGACVVIECRW